MSTNLDTQVWHDDGHLIGLMLNGGDLSVTVVVCPDDGNPEADCWHDDIEGCLVRHFITMYGLDCNVGICEPTPELTIAWSAQGNLRHIEEMQIWIIPVTDDMFASWRQVQPNPS